MKKDRLPPSFYAGRTTVRLARDLLGCRLVHESEEGIAAGLIAETEAYTEDDEACHAFGGRMTARNATMFRRAGHLYVYFVYGMYFCCNITAEREGKGCAVLLRSVRPTDGIADMRRRRRKNDLAGGPGKLCQAFGIGRRHDGLDLTAAHSSIYLTEGDPPRSVARTTRIGIRRATEKKWRFIAEE